ncbi:MAG TPA: PTS sugar transporter subunit IIA [Spirochaetia bacterium]|nr:PTS sugar transporter subunit IIA [Spirochaetales bacterium]HRW23178.1 PTS sugar transporter subunit IIA [Spirochaetia bacterium]
MALIDLIEESVVKVPLAAGGKDAAIRELVDTLVSAGKILDAETAYRAVLDREAKGSTGLEEGIAVPHGKTLAARELTIVIGVSPAGVEFGSMDGKPTRLFFLLLAPPDQAGPHIEALAEIARMSRSKAFCSSLAACRTPAEVVRLFKDE